jgi:cyclophilin family peptidyl-prolyl cis-trans isomerase
VVALVAPVSAQVVRFETSVGSFDMVLNPTNNVRLQGHVDNMIAYVRDHRYDGSWINRADVINDSPFVLQMGGFFTHTKRIPITVDSTRPVHTFSPIQGSPGIAGLSNTVGTVSLALPGGNSNGGTSSFFVNLTNNNFLDTNFTVFAAISDMAIVNQIMALTKVDKTTDPAFGINDTNNLAFTDIPLQSNGQQVLIKRAFVISDAMSVARANAAVESIIAASAASFTSAAESPAFSSASAAVPEPTTVALLLAGPLLLLGLRRRRTR